MEAQGPSECFPCVVTVMGRHQCVKTRCLVPPGGDSREQGDHIWLPFIREEVEKDEHKEKDPLHLTISSKNQRKSLAKSRGIKEKNYRDERLVKKENLKNSQYFPISKRTYDTCTPSVHTKTHSHTLVLPPGIIQGSGQNSSPLIMQMNMTLAGLGTRSHQHPYPAALCISDCVKSCFPIISRHRMDSILL